MAVRGAKSEDFKAFIKMFEKEKAKRTDADHKANMDMLNAKL